MRREVKCLNHIFSPEHVIRIEGWGNCRECLPDEENNRMCRGYERVEVEMDDENYDSGRTN